MQRNDWKYLKKVLGKRRGMLKNIEECFENIDERLKK